MSGNRLFVGTAWLCLVILALLPFHAFLTTWAGSNFGYLDVFRIWKELLLTVATGLLIILALRLPHVRRQLVADGYVRLALGYIALHLVLGLWAYTTGRVSLEALGYALLTNLRFVVFFVLCWVVASTVRGFRNKALLVVLMGGLGVIIIGLLQVFVLPVDFLRHFGYGPDTIPAYQTVDNKIAYSRVQSTLRGPNPLGAYLVLLSGLIVAYFWRHHDTLRATRLLRAPVTLRRQRIGIVFAGLCLLIVLFYTYSRSAYIGLLVTTASATLLAVSRRVAKWLLAGMIITLLIAVGSVYMLRNNDTIQNTVFHSDETSEAKTSSNADRASALQRGLRDVAHEPLGRGPGTAGPASFRNTAEPRIAEDYYLQIGQEVGWLGLALFVALLGIVAYRLWKIRTNWAAVGLLASLVGLSAVNLFSHAWADDSLGMLWWGLAGVVLGGQLLTVRHRMPDTYVKGKT